MAMRYEFLVDTYSTERVKVLSVWSMFRDADLRVRPHPTDPRGRSVLEQMVHQCVSEDLWFRSILGIDVGAPPLPDPETRVRFIRRYAEDSTKRLDDGAEDRPHGPSPGTTDNAAADRETRRSRSAPRRTQAFSTLLHSACCK